MSLKSPYVSECGGPVLKTINPGVQFTRCEDSELQDSGRTELVLTIVMSPTSDVLCKISSGDEREAGVAEPEKLFARDSPTGSSVTTAVFGVKDLPEQSTSSFLISVDCTSKDLRFQSTLTATGHTTDVKFPHIGTVLPVATAFAGQQVTLIGKNLGGSVVVGGVDVSEPPVLRTVLYNESEDLLWEVEFADEPAGLEWEQRASAAATSVSAIRRAAKTPQSSGNASDSADHTVDWYDYWSAFQARVDADGPSRLFSPNETYTSLPLGKAGRWTTGTLDELQLDVPRIRFVRAVSPGPLVFRTLLAAAALKSDHTILIFHEFAQRYNFSKAKDTITFITPAQTDVQAKLDNMYASIVLRSRGLITELTGVLLYTVRHMCM